MLAKPRKELNKQSPQKMAGLRVQFPPQVYKRAEKTRGFNSLDESGRRERLVWYLT